MRTLSLALLALSAPAVAQVPELTGPVAVGWHTPLGATGDLVSVSEMVLSPNHDTLFTCGSSSLASGDTVLQVAAFEPDSGHLRWSTNVTKPGSSTAWGGSIAVAPDGSRVYAAGAVWSGIFEDVLVTAINALTGEVVWKTSWSGTYGWDDWAGDLVVTPDGGRLYVTGTTTSAPLGDYDALLLALDAPSGGVLWSRAWDASGRNDFGAGVGLSPDGDTVYVVGTASTGEVCDTSGCETEIDLVALAYGADGTPYWTATVDTTAGPASTDIMEDRALGLEVDADAGRLVVGGWTRTVAATDDVGLAAAFALANGAELWRNTVSVPGAVRFETTAFEHHTDTGVAFLAGAAILNDPPGYQSEVGAVAVDTGDGAVLWSTTVGAPHEDDRPYALAVRADGVEVAVACRVNQPTTAYDADLGALGLDATSGALRWSVTLDGTASASNDSGTAMLAAPGARRWFLGGDLDQDSAPPGAVLALDRPYLWGDPPWLSVSAGGLHDLWLDLGAEYADDLYLVLGSLSGTDPGFPAPPIVLPLNWDVYLEFTLANSNSPFLPGTFGVVDPDGTALAALHLPPSAPPSLVGQTAHHACAVFEVVPAFALKLASNPTPLELLP